MALRPCLDCGTPTEGNRCAEHSATLQRTKDARRPARRSHAEQERRRAAVASHVERYGWLCPGHGGHPPHPSADLTADHIWQVADGGPEDGPLRVLCRPANSARGARAGTR
jgi:hypothetical protein